MFSEQNTPSTQKNQKIKQTKVVEKVTVKFAGDSGDGMQLTGSLFSDESALFGNDLATFPDYPAEIRAPAGTVAGVSGFQVQIGSVEILTPGDEPDALVAMNPAALKANIGHLRRGATIIVDTDMWTDAELNKAGYETDPLKTDIVTTYNIVQAPITSLTRTALEKIPIDNRAKDRCKNMFALGMTFWLFGREPKRTETYLKTKFAKKPDLAEASVLAVKAGYDYAQTIEAFATIIRVAPAPIQKGKYRQVSGNYATVLGMVAASIRSGRPLFLGSYPITPASEILQETSKLKEFGIKVVQAEDEIAGICMSIGASFGGHLAFTSTSGPGLALKSEALGLAVITELPLVVVNVQRGGPSTGLPTKTEQSDLLMALYGRHGECPVPVIAASSPGNCFDYAFIASKIALEHMTPVILLTDGFLGNGSEPWLIPNVAKLPAIKNHLVDPHTTQKPHVPFKRDETTLARNWAIPGMPGMMHRNGGLEKTQEGNVSYDPKNHEVMCRLRAEKVNRVQADIPDQTVIGDQSGDLLIVGWGGTYGTILTVVNELRREGKKISYTHFNYIHPMPKNSEEIFRRFKRIVVCELNLGQFQQHLTMLYPQISFQKFNKVQGLPFMTGELKEHFEKLLAEGK